MCRKTFASRLLLLPTFLILQITSFPRNVPLRSYFLAQRHIRRSSRNDLAEQLVGLDDATTGRQAAHIIENAGAKLWNSTQLTGSRRVSITEMRMLTKIDGDIAKEIGIYGDKDTDRLAAALGAVVIGAMFSGIATAQFLPGPPIIRFCVVWLCAFSPYIFLTLGINLPSTMQWALVLTQRTFFPSFRRRLLFHEAGHFLCGYLIGLPIENYSANSIVNAVQFYALAEKTRGSDLVKQLGFTPTTTRGNGMKENNPSVLLGLDGRESGNSKEVDLESFAGEFRKRAAREREQERDAAGRLIVDPDQAIDPANDPRVVWPFRGIDHNTIDKLAVVSLGGVMAEMIEFGDGEGGYADLSQLQGLLAAAEPAFEDREQQDRVRWAAVQSYTILKLYKGALCALVEAMDRQESVCGCISAIELCSDPRGETEEFRLAHSRVADNQNKGIFDGYLRRNRGLKASSRGVADRESQEHLGPLIDEGEVLWFASGTTALFLAAMISGVLPGF